MSHARGEMSGRVGANAGGFAWMLLLGIAIGNWILIVGPVVLALAGIYLLRKPGHVALWVVGWCAVAINLYWDEVPEQILGFSTGKDMLSLWMVNVFLGAGLLLGLWFSVRAES